jgi:UDP:flavonoid glycosyltransferase YjiC (YdhE family)
MQMKHISYALRRFQPDVLVGQQLTMGPLLVGELRRIPVALLGLFVYLWLGSDPIPGQVLSNRQGLQAWRHQDMLKYYNEARKRLGIAPRSANAAETPLLGDLFMLRSIPAFEKGLDDLPKKVHLVGDCLWEEQHNDPELDAWLNAAVGEGCPIIYVQHGRTFDKPGFWANLVEGLAGTNMRVAVSSSRMDCSIGNVPSNFFVRPFLPQGRVLRVASALVTTANTTAVLGALTAGVPGLLVPAGGEEPDVAEQCENAGVARVLAIEMASPARLGSELRQLLEDENTKNAARRISAKFAQLDSFNITADLLERLAQAKAPVLRSEQKYVLESAI